MEIKITNYYKIKTNKVISTKQVFDQRKIVQKRNLCSHFRSISGIVAASTPSKRGTRVQFPADAHFCSYGIVIFIISFLLALVYYR